MPPHKKRRLSSPPDIDPNVEECVQEIAAEIDLEIGVKQRLADTIESRITWALILQESLQKGMCLQHNHLARSRLTSHQKMPVCLQPRSEMQLSTLSRQSRPPANFSLLAKSPPLPVRYLYNLKPLAHLQDLNISMLGALPPISCTSDLPPSIQVKETVRSRRTCSDALHVFALPSHPCKGS